MNKPVKPNITIPESFAKNGIKTDFDSDLITEGFDSLKPDVLAGDNLNKFIDDTYKGLNYGIAAGDAINLIQEGETLTVQNGQLVSGSTGGGLELCDIGTALYVDETKGLRRYLNGQIVDINTNTQAFLNRLKEIQTTNPDYFTTEDNWQTESTLNVDGCVYKFVLNYSGETIVSVRLPKYPDYVEINAGGTLPVVGNGKALGYTNGTIEGVWGNTNGWGNGDSRYFCSGLLKKSLPVPVGTSLGFGVSSFPYAHAIGITTNPSKSGIQTTLKQTKLKMRYFIQIATGSETEANIVNTLENVNGFTLLESKYSDKPLYNESWLLSNGQWNAKAVYPTVYEGLQVEYNSEIEAGTTVTLPSGVSYTKRGLSVKLSTEEYTDYDFVLNTANETFRLPLLDGSEDLIGSGVVNYAVPTKDEQTYIATYNGQAQLNATTTAENQFIRITNVTTGTISEMRPPMGGVESIASTWVNRGDIFKIIGDVVTTIYSVRLFKAQGNGSLYYYVGETVQNANLIDAGRIGEQLANKIGRTECKAYITETYVNGTSWYRVWSDGWCEQGGYAADNSSVTFLKPYTNNSYTLIGSGVTGSEYGPQYRQIMPNSKSATGFSSTVAGGTGVWWQASGYIA